MRGSGACIFTKETKLAMYQDAVMVPVGDWTDDRLAKLSEVDWTRPPSQSGSNFARNISNWVGRDFVYPTNVLHAATECGSPDHSAPFPEALPEFFIKLFTAEGDLVLDPLLGSGTTLRVAGRVNRRGIGIERMPAYCEQVCQELGLRRAA
jgi:site-specific DNA-methyltransferase (adenine-specific)